MASLIPGYNYDIFISYRQKDNKHDGWVSEFVDQLKGELEGTFKEDISIYFDINPHDGLLETHDVDASLKSKLKCPVFIPIISRTYCDPKSFAWEHEFKEFIDQASRDPFGLKITLPSGNVTNRILPIRIHELDTEDKSLLENELGGVLRAIDFIYKEPGVNRPLTPDDDEKINLNKTKYRNQINKVANAIREIVTAIGQYQPQQEGPSKEIFKPIPVPRKTNKTPIIAGSIILLALILLGVFLVPKLVKSRGGPDKSIAVLPFKLLSDEPDKQYLADGMMEAIHLHLSKIRDLRVIPSTSVEQYRKTSKTVKTIGQELNVEYVLEGNFQKYGDKIKLIIQLFRAEKESQVWGDEYDRDWKDVFNVQSEVAQTIADTINVAVSPQEKKIIESPATFNLTAYDYYLRGDEYHKRSYREEDYRFAIQMYEKATGIDPNFALAWMGLAACARDLYWHSIDRSEGNLSMAKVYLDKALALSPKLKEVRIEEARYYYHCKRDYSKSIELLEKLKTEYPNEDDIYAWIGYQYRRMGEFRKSLEQVDQAITLNSSYWEYWYIEGLTFEALREYKKAESYYKKSLDLNPSNLDGYKHLFNLFVVTDQIQKATDFIKSNENTIDVKDVNQFKARIEFLARNYSKAVQITESLSEGEISLQYDFCTKHLQLGLIYRTIPDHTMAITHFEIERKFLLNKIRESANDERLYSSLGIACAGLGLKEQALEAGGKALEILDPSKDVEGGYFREIDLVKILVMVGEYDKALTKLDHLIKLCGYLTAEILKLDPFWDPVRNNKKFQEIISNPEYQVHL